MIEQYVRRDCIGFFVCVVCENNTINPKRVALYASQIKWRTMI